MVFPRKVVLNKAWRKHLIDTLKYLATFKCRQVFYLNIDYIFKSIDRFWVFRRIKILKKGVYGLSANWFSKDLMVGTPAWFMNNGFPARKFQTGSATYELISRFEVYAIGQNILSYLTKDKFKSGDCAENLHTLLINEVSQMIHSASLYISRIFHWANFLLVKHVRCPVTP